MPSPDTPPLPLAPFIADAAGAIAVTPPGAEPYRVYVGDESVEPDGDSVVYVVDAALGLVAFEPREEADGLAVDWGDADADDPPMIAVRGGESAKTFARLQQLLQTWLELGLTRRSIVVGIGGGTILDLTGLAASLYQRGIRWIAQPTTVLAMVDASVGGKTAINVGDVKNVVGTFHHPVAVICNPAVLASLPETDYRAGWAEAVKVAFTLSAPFFEWLEANVGRLLARDADAVRIAVRESIRLKAAVVDRDPFEKDFRRVLNFGHTLGHAFEMAMAPPPPHGEAVALGMAAVASGAVEAGDLPESDADRLTDLLVTLGLLERYEEAAAAHGLSRWLLADKKRDGDGIHWVVPEGVGRVRIGPHTKLDDIWLRDV